MDHRFITDHSDPLFQDTFAQYFSELGIKETDLSAVYKNMDEETKTKSLCTLGLYEGKSLIGFVMYQDEKLANWFFEESFVFVREIYIKKEARNRGNGTALLGLVLSSAHKRGLRKAILTSETASSFYEKNGFSRYENLRAKNDDPVFVKAI